MAIVQQKPKVPLRDVKAGENHKNIENQSNAWIDNRILVGRI